jgi:hypothetical protein
MKKIIISALVASSLAMAGGDIVPVEPVVETPIVEANPWKNEVYIYGWLPSISASTPLPNSPNEIEASDILDKLKMVFMGGYSGRNDTWSVFADYIYFKMGDSKTRTLPDLGDIHVGLDMDATLIHAGAGYNLIDTGDGLLDLAVGVRYLDLGVDFRYDGVLINRTAEPSKDFTDFFVGVRGVKNINKNWYIPYEADVGTGDTDLSWQLFAGVGYRYDWGDVKLGYRYLEFDMEDDAIVQDLTLSGAALGVSIKF